MSIMTRDELLAVTGKFSMTFTKIGGESRTGLFSVAVDQRETKNPNLVTLVEHLGNDVNQYRAIDIERHGITQFQLFRRRETSPHLKALRKLVKAANDKYKKAYTNMTKTRGFAVKLFDIKMTTNTILNLQRYALECGASYHAKYNAKGQRSITIYFNEMS